MKQKEQKTLRGFIKKSAVFTVVLGILGLGIFIPLNSVNANGKDHSTGLSIDQDLVMKSGFAERDITPEIGTEETGGFGKVIHTSMHDPCKVRAVVFNDGTKRVALVGVDAEGIWYPLIENARKRIHDRCGISSEAILIGASHSHSSGPTGTVHPGEFDYADEFVKWLAYEKSPCADAKYMEYVENQVVEAVIQADSGSVKSEMGVGKGIEDMVAFNRRFRMKNGMTWTHPGQLNPDIVEPAGPIDPEVGVIGVWDKKGKCIGCVVNYTCHATVNPGGISANYIYYIEQTIRGAMGPDCIVVFLQGASGDVTQVDNQNPFVFRHGEDWTRFVGGRIGAEAVKVLLSMPRGILAPLDFHVKVLEIKHRFPSPERVRESYELVKQAPEQVGTTNWIFAKEVVLLNAKVKKEPIEKVEVSAIQVGPAVFITNPGELFCQLGLNIKAKSPFEYTFVVELANGYVGYIPTAEAFGSGGGGYETRFNLCSSLEVQAGNRIVEAGLELARQMKPGNVPEFQKAQPVVGKPWEYGNVKPDL